MTIGMGPVRGMLPTDFGLFAVSGSQAYMLTTALAPTLLGTIGTSSGPVSIVANTNQVALFDGVGGYAWSVATGFITLVLPFPNPGTAVYQDGYVLVNQVGTFFVWQCDLNDLTTWSALAFDSEDGSAENIVALAEFHEQIAVLKEQHVAFWVDEGTIPFAFARLDGVYMQRGCAAPYSVIVADETLLWLGQSEEGQGVIYAAKGYEGERISTFAIEYQLAQYPTIADCVAFPYLLEGHTFVVFNFPTANATWVYDITASRRLQTPMWYEWGDFIGGQIIRWAPNCQALFAGLVLVGDCVNGNIYSLDMDTLTDNGAAKKCLRSWRALPQGEYRTAKCNYLAIGCDTGLQVAPGSNPQLVLRQSLDGGLNWSAEMYQSAGATGATAQTIQFNRLGATRRGLNNDRIFELSTTDQWKIGWLAADMG